MSKSPSLRRIQADIRELSIDPSDQYHAAPLESDMFVWHFTIRGAPDTDFEHGIYHGKILLSSEYPFKPPDIMFLTPNGRFETNTKLCLSFSAYHPELWQPAWGIRLILEALISFLPTKGDGAIGALDWTSEERKRLAKKSWEYNSPVYGNVKEFMDRWSERVKQSYGGEEGMKKKKEEKKSKFQKEIEQLHALQAATEGDDQKKKKEKKEKNEEVEEDDDDEETGGEEGGGNDDNDNEEEKENSTIANIKQASDENVHEPELMDDVKSNTATDNVTTATTDTDYCQQLNREIEQHNEKEKLDTESESNYNIENETHDETQDNDNTTSETDNKNDTVSTEEPVHEHEHVPASATNAAVAGPTPAPAPESPLLSDPVVHSGIIIFSMIVYLLVRKLQVVVSDLKELESQFQ